jgi:hypothetical protein
MSYWWLNQSAKFANSDVVDGGKYLWAPRLTETGKHVWHWDLINEVNSGDIIFAYRKKLIHAVAIAHGTAYKADMPDKLGYKKIWETRGYRLDVEFNRLGEKSLSIPSIYGSIKSMLPNKYSPFDKNGRGNESYLHPISQILGEQLLREAEFSPRVSNIDYVKSFASKAPGGPLDKVVAGTTRTEQNFLRQELFKKDKFSMKESDVCAICGNEYPINLLVAAHIKKRSKCSENEKRDHKNIVMPLCKFGCDDLYERGYIAVIRGKVSILDQSIFTKDLMDYFSKIEGKRCSYWKPATEKYFRDHHKAFINI